jgi:hypothetical protein
MGGFHIALYYLSLLGKKYAQSGLDMLIESVAGTTSVIMLCKSYNRGIRAYKLTMEALFRLLWQAFVEWLEREEVGLENRAKQLILCRSKECRNTVKQEDFFADNWSAFQGCIEPLMLLLDTFKLESRKKSKVFNFWEDYINMVLLLLQFVKELNELGTGSFISPLLPRWFPISFPWTGSTTLDGCPFTFPI